MSLCVCVWRGVMGSRKSDGVFVCVWRGVMGSRKSDGVFCVCAAGEGEGAAPGHDAASAHEVSWGHLCIHILFLLLLLAIIVSIAHIIIIIVDTSGLHLRTSSAAPSAHYTGEKAHGTKVRKGRVLCLASFFTAFSPLLRCLCLIV